MRGETTRAPHCEVCPPHWDWPHKNLILGYCPRCGAPPRSVRSVVRALNAKRLIQERFGA